MLMVNSLEVDISDNPNEMIHCLAIFCFCAGSYLIARPSDAILNEFREFH